MPRLGYDVIGTCSNCQGAVCVPRVWSGVQKPTPRCEGCGATPIPSHGPVIPMQPAPGRTEEWFLPHRTPRVEIKPTTERLPDRKTPLTPHDPEWVRGEVTTGTPILPQSTTAEEFGRLWYEGQGYKP